MIEVVEFKDDQGRSPFAIWLNALDHTTNARITTAIFRLESGNLSAAKSIGHSLFELRLDFGPGYRIYFGNDGERLIILLGGGSKRRQQHDIEAARVRWSKYKLQK